MLMERAIGYTVGKVIAQATYLPSIGNSTPVESGANVIISVI